MGEKDRKRKVESALIIRSEEEIIKDKENKENRCRQASKAVSSIYELYNLCSEHRNRKWYYVEIRRCKQRDEQIAFLVDVLKCDKPKVCSMHEFSRLFSFYAFMTEEELRKLSEPKIVKCVRPGNTPRIRREQNKPWFKEQKLGIGSRRRNKEEWRYNHN